MPRAELLSEVPTAAAGVHEFEAIGVPWRIDTQHPLADVAREAVVACTDAFDRAWSRFRTDSLVAEIARTSGERTLPPEGAGLLALYRTLYDLTAGRVSPFVGAALEDLGYGRRLGVASPASGSPGPPGSVVPAWDDVASLDGDVLSTAAPVVLDVGAAGKGLLVDLVLEVLADHGVHDATVDASGDLRVSGRRRERVALEHPFDPTRAIGVVDVADGALCASATNRRSWGDGLHHVIDGLTGRPVDSIVATWALAPTAAVADAAATALFFVSPAEVHEATGALGVRMFSTGRSERHRDFTGELFS
ncbi:FAD:protein FMN transferase [Labedella phragmitis]|uniref:FAD:protein FMN transferase n=1 Tax=Labedella phragmitis TaxID=2498849 RepID=A0A444PPS8_9MICO|nr:FAD:protein FMN transferase [Labedella phragmitis]RWZ46415.1 FAD:protein FMN transferase [Labedella phragmitis]